MKREAQAARTGQDPRKKKEASRGEQGPSGGLQNLSRDRRSVFNRIAKGKPSVSDSKLTPLNTSRSHILAVMEQNHLSRVPPKITGKSEKSNSHGPKIIGSLGDFLETDFGPNIVGIINNIEGGPTGGDS